MTQKKRLQAKKRPPRKAQVYRPAAKAAYLHKLAALRTLRRETVARMGERLLALLAEVEALERRIDALGAELQRLPRRADRQWAFEWLHFARHPLALTAVLGPRWFYRAAEEGWAKRNLPTSSDEQVVAPTRREFARVYAPAALVRAWELRVGIVRLSRDRQHRLAVLRRIERALRGLRGRRPPAGGGGAAAVRTPEAMRAARRRAAVQLIERLQRALAVVERLDARLDQAMLRLNTLLPRRFRSLTLSWKLPHRLPAESIMGPQGPLWREAWRMTATVFEGEGTRAMRAVTVTEEQIKQGRLGKWEGPIREIHGRVERERGRRERLTGLLLAAWHAIPNPRQF